MKKWLAFACTAALLTALFVIPAAAYRDADGDGVCDYAGTSCRFADEDGDGVCDYSGTGRMFVDADGDGLCDRGGLGTGLGGCGRGNCGGGRWR